MRVTGAEATELFVGDADDPVQIVRVSYSGATEPTAVRVAGDGLGSVGTARTATGDGVIEVAVRVDRPDPGDRLPAVAVAGDSTFAFEFTVADPGWTMYMISHFHYDPVWWNTQGAYTSLWTEDPPGACKQNNAFALVAAHLEMARRDPVYKFVLAEVDYLKPYFDAHPEDRADLLRFIAERRVEVMGGTYNEPNTNLTGAETSIRNFVHGIGFQRDVLGADPATAWQLDVFGHDPQFPGMAADAVQEHLETDAIVQVFAGVDFVADIDAHGIGMVQDRPPALGQLVKGRLAHLDKVVRAHDAHVRPVEETKGALELVAVEAERGDLRRCAVGP